ncbi:MAG: isocitrate lyase/phosphoenolpyruvate mutase family protein, partial [Gaiellales bacterium]
AAAVELPVSADLEAGYGDVGETLRRAIAVGAVGANIEDQMRPLPEAAALMAAAVAAAEGEGVPFALNARTDVYLRGGDRDRGELLEDAVARGRAFLDAGATCVFVPGRLDVAEIEALVAGIGQRKLSVLAGPGFPAGSELEAMGVARISFGPWTQRLALTALLDAGADLLAGGSLPDWVRPVA